MPTGLARGSGLGNIHRSSAGARAAGPVRQEADPGLSQGAGVCLRPSRAVRAIPVARQSQPGPEDHDRQHHGPYAEPWWASPWCAA